MNITNFIHDEDAVSPVIGVILMVAITVILAAVIGTFVLGLGDQVQETAPNAQFNWNQDGSVLEVTHQSGSSIKASTMKVSVSSGSLSGDDCSSGNHWGGTSEVTAGQTCQVEDGSGTVQGTYRLTWDAAGSDQSSTLTEYEA